MSNSKKRGVLYLLGALLLSSCSGSSEKSQRTDTLTSGVVQISADESFAPIVQQQVDVFENKYPNASIIPIFVNEKEAINLLLSDSVRLAIATRRLHEKEKQTLLKEHNLLVREEKIATDGIAIIVNHQNPDSLISVVDLRKIMTGQITQWSELNPKSTLGEVKLVFDNSNSSTVRFAIDSICRGEKFASELLYTKQNNPEVIDIVSKTPGAIGLIGAAWINNKSDSTHLSFIDDVKVMSVSKSVGANVYNSYKPYQAYLATGDYPLARDVYTILTESRKGLSASFAIFVATDIGQRIILRSGIVPATQNIRLVNIKEKI